MRASLVRVAGVVDGALLRAREIEAKQGEVQEAKRDLDQAAAGALRLVHELSSRVECHKTELFGRLQGVRKDCCQPVADATNACLALRSACHAGGWNDHGGALEEHLELVAVTAGRAGKRRRRAWGIAFVAHDPGRCKVQVERDGQWDAFSGVLSKPLPPLNVPRSFLCAAVVPHHNAVFVAAGHDHHGCPDDLERLDCESFNRWRAGPRLPTPRHCCGACAIGNAVVVAGGWGPGYDNLDVVEAVNVEGDGHTTLPPLPKRFGRCGVVSLHGKVIVTGGNDGRDLDDVWALNIGEQGNLHQRLEWEPLPRMGQARGFHGAAAGDGRVFVCAGYCAGNVLDSCEVLDLREDAQGHWNPLPSMPAPVRDVGCCFGGGNVFVAGGQGGALFALNVRNSQWTRVAELATTRRGCAAVCVGRRVLVLGGFSDDLRRYLGSCEVFEF